MATVQLRLLESVKNALPHELGIIIEAVAETQEQANTICSFARSTMLHYGFAALYSMTPDKVISFVEFASAKLIKITLERPRVCGDVGDNDVYKSWTKQKSCQL